MRGDPSFDNPRPRETPRFSMTKRMSSLLSRVVRPALAPLLALVAATSGAAPAPVADVVQFYHSDPLGSVRAVTNMDGEVVSRHDYLPFGEDIPCTEGGRDAFGYCGDNSDLKLRFAGKERDRESDLSYFGARYYSGIQGRFVTPDDIYNDTDVTDPASWNRYVYVRNNPPTLIDPDGRSVWTKVGKFILKGGDIGLTVAGVVEDAGTLFALDVSVGVGPRLVATGSLASELLPVSGRDVKELAEFGGKFLVKNADKANEVVDASKVVANNVDDSKKVLQRFEKPPTGRGSVPPAERDPKRVYRKKQKKEVLEKRGGTCDGCDKPVTVDDVDGHHVKRHADGGHTTEDNLALFCEDCHKEIHSGSP
jgi:RHS repeat-associated protein